MLDLQAYFHRYDRQSWASYRASEPLCLSAEEVWRLRGQTEQVTVEEIAAIYLPLARLIGVHARAGRRLRQVTSDLLPGGRRRAPFVVGVAGSVAAGKSTTSRVLGALLRRLPGGAAVDIVNTDGFLRPTAWLEAHGLMHRKGFPESYDHAGMIAALAAIKAGTAAVRLPIYSHYHYDIVPGGEQVVDRPAIVLVEGLNLLQGAPRACPEGPFAGDFLDFSVYVDAEVETLRAWYLQRFLLFRAQARADPQAYFHRFAGLGDADASHFAEQVWQEINERNLRRHILPYRARARLILHKLPDHRVDTVYLRHT